MPKRTKEKDLDYYLKKIKKIERKIKRRKHEIDKNPGYLDDRAKSASPFEQAHTDETEVEMPTTEASINSPLDPADNAHSADNELQNTSEEVLLALGDLMPEKPAYGPDINPDLARIWSNILKNGISKEAKDKVMEKLVPNNCALLKAPKLNPEIIASVNDTIVNRDKKIEAEQNQLGIGLTIFGTGLSNLINNESVDRLKLISTLSEAGRVFADLHFLKTTTRKNLVYPTLDKKILDVVKEVDRDEFIYGKELAEKIKALQSMQRSGKTIKKVIPTPTRQGNFNGPPRFSQPRTSARGGQRRMQSSAYHRKYQQPFLKKPRAPPARQPPART